MIISVSYYVGEQKQYHYFESFVEVNKFMDNFVNVFKSDFETCEMIIYRGEDEERVRKGIKIKEEKQGEKK
jgi:hypothetical protein